MFATLCGGPEHLTGVPASEPPRWGPRPWPWRRCSLPAAESSSDSNEHAGTYKVAVTDASFPPNRSSARPR